MIRNFSVSLSLCISDVVDWILRNLISTSRSYRGVSKKLRELGYSVVTKVGVSYIYTDLRNVL